MICVLFDELSGFLSADQEAVSSSLTTRTKKPAESKGSAGFRFLAGFQNRERNRAITNLLQMLFPSVLGLTGRW